MEEQEEFSEKDYTNGFNDGYNLRERKPDLYQLVITNIKGRSDYLDGLVDGGNEQEAEHFKQRYKEHIINQQRNSNSQDRNR